MFRRFRRMMNMIHGRPFWAWEFQLDQMIPCAYLGFFHVVWRLPHPNATGDGWDHTKPCNRVGFSLNYD